MYYVLFHKKNGEKNYRAYQTEDEALSFLMKKGKDIHVDKVIESLAELKLGFTVINSKDMEFVENIDFFTEEAEKLRTEEKKEEVTDAEIIQKNKEALKKADVAIEHAAEDLKSDKKLEWKTCPKCKVNRVAPWSKHQECSFCRRPKGTRKYDMTKRGKSKK